MNIALLSFGFLMILGGCGTADSGGSVFATIVKILVGFAMVGTVVVTEYYKSKNESKPRFKAKPYNIDDLEVTEIM